MELTYRKEVFNFLEEKHPILTNKYKDNLKVAEQTILHQLIQALLRESIVNFEITHEINKTIATLRLNESERLVIPIKKKYILMLIDVEGDVRVIDKNENERFILSPEQLIELLNKDQHLTSYVNKEQFLAEIVNSKVNYAFALTIGEQRREDIIDEAESHNTSDLLSYVMKKKEIDHSFSALSFFEQWVIQGHTIHPCSRTRLGLSPQSISEYAPEWEGRPNVIPVAVHKEFCQLTNLENPSVTKIILDEYSNVATQFHALLSEKKLNANDYELIPVHPWQLEHTISHNYQEELQNDWIIPIHKTPIKTAALISFRSLAPQGNLSNHHIKTAINVQMTSAVRTVSAASTYNGPIISSVLERIYTDDAIISSTVSFMREKAGIHFEPKQSSSPSENNFLQKNLAAILRENPEKELLPDEIAIPAATLISMSPITEQSLIEELIERFASDNANISTAAEEYIEKYANVLLPGVLTLITKYGISMEVHLQNCICVFRNGLPERIIIRDNGGIRIMEERLNHFYELESLNNSTNLMTTKYEELLDTFFHAIVHNHLGEIIVTLSRNLQIDEERLWKRVRKVVDQVYASLERDASIPSKNFRDRDRLLSKHSRMKALVKMRLTNKFTDNLYVEVANPLYSRSEVLSV